MVFDIFKRLTSEFNQTLLVVTHDNSFAERTDRIIEMEDGRIIRQKRIKREPDRNPALTPYSKINPMKK